jgi:hypothetical protein
MLYQARFIAQGYYADVSTVYATSSSPAGERPTSSAGEDLIDDAEYRCAVVLTRLYISVPYCFSQSFYLRLYRLCVF